MPVKQIFYGLMSVVTVSLTVMTLQRMLTGWWRRYLLLTLLLILNLLIMVPSMAWTLGSSWTPISQSTYWVLAAISQSVIFLFVLHMMYRLGRDSGAEEQMKTIRLLTAAALALACISLVSHSGSRSANWMMTKLSRDLTFIAAGMNMVLWTFLLKIKKRDGLMMMVCAGLGIQCTGDAVGQSIRSLNNGHWQELGNAFMSITSMLTMFIWHKAFTRVRTTGDVGGGTGKTLTAPGIPAR